LTKNAHPGFKKTSLAWTWNKPTFSQGWIQGWIQPWTRPPPDSPLGQNLGSNLGQKFTQQRYYHDFPQTQTQKRPHSPRRDRQFVNKPLPTLPEWGIFN